MSGGTLCPRARCPGGDILHGGTSCPPTPDFVSFLQKAVWNGKPGFKASDYAHQP